MPSERNDGSPQTDRCRECDRAVAPDANFCPGCGADLRAAEPRSDPPPAYCTECGEPVAPDDEFCANCGAPRGGTAASTAEVNRASTINPDVTRASTIDPDVTADSHARREFRARVRDHLNAGWELREDHGDWVVLVDRDIGSIPIHVLLLLTTGGVGNLLYGWYHHSELAETRRLSVSDGPLPDGELATPRDEDPLAALSGYLLGGLLLFIGLGVAAVSIGQGTVLGALFGLAFAAIGLWLTPPAERRLGRRHAVSRFGRIRTVDHRITPATERTEAPCVVCDEDFERGVVRRRRDETVFAGVPIRTHSIRRNHYCADCAREELLSGDVSGTEIDPGVDLGAVDFDDSEFGAVDFDDSEFDAVDFDDSEFDAVDFDDSELGRDEGPERKRERER